VSVSVMVTLDAKSYEILGRVIAEVAPWLNVMDLKIFRSSANLAAPAVPLQDFMAQLAIRRCARELLCDSECTSGQRGIRHEGNAFLLWPWNTSTVR
jgi:hypothetical protein